MPALVLFGHRTSVAGDDLRCVSFFVVLLRVLQIAALAPLLYFFLQIDRTSGDTNNECTDADKHTSTAALMFLFWALTAIVVMVSLVLEAVQFRTSGKGTPTQPHERRLLQPLCCFKIIPFSLLRIAAFALGLRVTLSVKDFCTCTLAAASSNTTISANNKEIYVKCPTVGPLSTMLSIVVITMGIEVGFSLLTYHKLIFKTIKPRRYLHSAKVSAEKKWACCCRCCCSVSSLLTCCFFGGIEAINADFTVVSIALADFMSGGGHLDVTLSDITAGIAVVQLEQEKQKQECRRQLKENVDAGSQREHTDGPRTSVSVLRMSRQRDGIQYEAHDQLLLDLKNNAVDRQAILEGAHFMRLSLAMYGHLMYLLDNALTGPCVLGATSMNCRRSCCFWSSENIVRDNACGCNTIAMRLQAGLEQDNIAYAQFGVGLERTPYSISIDREWKSVVLAVRGTFSVEDAVADLMIQPVSLEACGKKCNFDGQGAYCHAGMLGCAQWIYNDIERQGVLDRLLCGGYRHCLGYQFIVTGHSLGAGCAAILALMLQSKFPALKCLCFEPPGCVFSADIADQPYTTSYVLDDDIVPRMSLQSFERLRDDVLEGVARLKVPKYLVFDEYFYGARKKDETDDSTYVHPKANIPSCAFTEQLCSFKQHQQERKAFRDAESNVPDVHLFLPGKKIVHMIRTSEARGFWSVPPITSGQFGETYTAVWAPQGAFVDVQISGSFIADHSPSTVCQELERIAASIQGMDHRP